MKSWADIGFEIEITGDGSPSLRLLTSVDPNKERGESMHHSGGACAETNLIYGEPVREVLLKIKDPHFMIVGLGLGYIELVIAREALLLGKNPREVGLITSYESVPELREFYVQWLQGLPLDAQVQETYDLMLQHILVGTDLDVQVVKAFVLHHFPTSSSINDGLSAQVLPSSKYHCILYDAFSSKTSPFLWEEEFLTQLLHQATAPASLLATYACKGSLKRALKAEGFEVVVREGFQGKRNSTQGRRSLV